MEAVTDKLREFNGDLTGQDIGIAMYGLQGLNPATSDSVRELIGVFAEKVKQSDVDLDGQALSNALYGLQSMSSDYIEVLRLVSALSEKVAESNPY